MALSPAPTMITLNGGGNDMLRPGMDADRLAAMSEVAVRRCLDAGVRPVLLSGPDPTDRLPFGRVVRKRGDALTVAIEQLRDRYSLTLINIFHDTSMHHPGYWSPDRLHLNPAGHARVAMLVLTGLGYDASAIAQVPPTTYSTGPRAEAQFYWQHVRPWLHRRVKRQSSGDGRSSKHHSWATVPPQPVQ